jgi:hypothetical protein
MLLTVHLGQHPVGRHKRDLHAREKRGEQHRN